MADDTPIKYQPSKSISKQLGLSVTTHHVRGGYDTLEEYVKRVNVGLPPPLDTGWTEFGTGNTTSCHLQREAGDIGTLAISVAEKSNTETWLLEWVEYQKDIRTWPGTDPHDKPNLKQLHAWEALASTNETAYNDYIYNVEENLTLSGSTLELAKMIHEEGIESYMIFTPSITRVSTLVDLTDFSSNVGKIETPTATNADSVVGQVNVAKLTATASQWLKTADRIQTALDGSVQRVETWLGADIWNSKLYKSATTTTS